MTSSDHIDLITSEPPSPLEGSSIKAWMLADDMTFLNHGSFGGLPRAVAAAQREFKDLLESDPYEAIWGTSRDQLLAARSSVAEFVGCTPENLVTAVNASDAINSVLRSIRLKPGQSIVASTHGYYAVTQTMRFVADRAGAQLRELPLFPPLPDEAGILKAFDESIDRDTALVMVDHVSSPTAMKFPVEQIVAMCRDRNVPVMVDGAHAPGMIDLDVEAIGADFYTGNLHKWVSAPTGAAFLHVDPRHQSRIHPTIISHYLGDGYQDEFHWLGTRDTTAFLAAPSAIKWFDETFGWPEVRRHNRQLVSWAAGRLCEAWGVTPLDVPSSSSECSMRTIRLPERVREGFDDIEQWRAWLRHEHRIDAAVHDWAGEWWLRLSAHVYNRPEDYVRLAEVGLLF